MWILIRNIFRKIFANFCEIFEDPSGYHCKVLEYHARLLECMEDLTKTLKIV